MRRATLLTTVLLFLSADALARDVPVTNADELRAAITGAAPGDVILLADGTYRLTSKISMRTDGTEQDPIVVRAQNPHQAEIEVDGVIGFHIQAPHWRVEDLRMRGVCEFDSQCEHAFQITGRADHAVLRNVIAADFNAHVKAGGTVVEDVRVFPDDVLLEGNEFYGSRPRVLRAGESNPVTFVDVVGGRRWVVRANYIHDFQKMGSDNISYGMFLKGNSKDGVFERNLVVCSNTHDGGTRVGISFGGGGTGQQFCEDGGCDTEHVGGVMRNNIIANCSAIGIYLNKSAATQIHHNILYKTSGIDVRFDTSTADVRNNVLSGRLRNRDGGTHTAGSNLTQVSEADFRAWFRNPDALDFTINDGSALIDQGEVVADVTNDYCGAPRPVGAHDIGALEVGPKSDCDTTRPPWGDAPISEMDPEPTQDMGTPDMSSPDMGAPDMRSEDMGAADMSAPDAGRPDMASPALDMQASDMANGAPDMEAPSDTTDGCACAHVPAQAPPPELLALLLAGVLVRRRGTSS